MLMPETWSIWTATFLILAISVPHWMPDRC